MDRILDEVGLGHLMRKFAEERITPQRVLNLDDYELANIGVTKILQRNRLRKMCKEKNQPIKEKTMRAAAVNPEMQEDVPKMEVYLSGALDFKTFFSNLSLVGRFIRLTYHGVAGESDLWKKVQKLGYHMVDVCDMSALAIASFSRTANEIFASSKITYNLLLEEQEEMALVSFVDTKPVAEKMEDISNNVHTKIKEVTKDVQTTLEEIRKAKELRDQKNKKVTMRQAGIEGVIQCAKSTYEKNEKKLKECKANAEDATEKIKDLKIKEEEKKKQREIQGREERIKKDRKKAQFWPFIWWSNRYPEEEHTDYERQDECMAHPTCSSVSSSVTTDRHGIDNVREIQERAEKIKKDKRATQSQYQTQYRQHYLWDETSCLEPEDTGHKTGSKLELRQLETMYEYNYKMCTKLKEELANDNETIDEQEAELQKCIEEKPISETIVDALHTSVIYLKNMSLTMEEIGSFWKQFGGQSSGVSKNHFRAQIKEALELSEGQRRKLWRGKEFNEGIQKYVNRWKELHDVCSNHMKQIKLIHSELHFYITENPTLKESRDIVEKLSRELRNELEKAPPVF